MAAEQQPHFLTARSRSSLMLAAYSFLEFSHLVVDEPPCSYLYLVKMSFLQFDSSLCVLIQTHSFHVHAATCS